MFEVVVCDVKAADESTLHEVLGDVATVRTASPTTPTAVVDAAGGADALIVDANTPVTADVIRALDLTVVGRAGVGVDNVDLDAAEAAGVAVVNVPDYCLDEVSTHTVGLFLACVRELRTYDRATAAGSWDWTDGRPLHRLRDQVVGVLAFGAIARHTCEKLSGFGLDVLVHDPYVPAAEMEARGVEPEAFDAMLDRADHLIVHAPLTDETRGVVDAAALERLPDHGVVVNTARGGVVREEALVDALDRGTIAAAGVDVLETEPPSGSALVDHDRTIVTPHCAWYSEESRVDLATSVAEDVARVLRGEDPRNPVDADWG